MPLGMLVRPFDPDSLGGVTDETSERPVQDTDDQNELVLGSREISGENIDKGNRATNDAYVKPPQNPVVDSYIDMHKRLQR
jgi:hypothetical protein